MSLVWRLSAYQLMDFSAVILLPSSEHHCSRKKGLVKVCVSWSAFLEVALWPLKSSFLNCTPRCDCGPVGLEVLQGFCSGGTCHVQQQTTGQVCGPCALVVLVHVVAKQEPQARSEGISRAICTSCPSSDVQ